MPEFGVTPDELGSYHDLNLELSDRTKALAKAGGPAAIGQSLRSDPKNGILPVSHEQRKQT